MIMKLVHVPFQKAEQFKDVLSSCVSIRKEVFIDEQSVPYTIEQDGMDAFSSHLLLIVKEVPVATLRIRKTSEGIKLERIAVLKEYRGMGYGKNIVSHALHIMLKEDPDSIIYVHAQQNATPFYSSLGFTPTGETTIEAKIAHVTMVYIHTEG